MVSEVSIPALFTDTYSKGIFHSFLIEQDYSEIFRQFMKYDKISDIAFSDYLNYFDLTLRKSVGRIFGDDEICNVLDTNDKNILLDSNYKIMKYLEILTENRDRPYFISETNFLFNQAKDRMSTADFRVLINDFTNTVPKYVLMHIGSLSIMILSNKLSSDVGIQRIKDILEVYGTVKTVLIKHNCIHLNVVNHSIFKIFSPKQGGNLVRKSK